MANEAQVQEKAAEIRRMLEEIAFLSKSDLPTHEYFRRFLELVARSLDAPGGVIWLKGGQGFQRLTALKFADCEYDTNDAQRQSIIKALGDVSENRRPLIVGAFDANAAADENVTVINRTRYPFFFYPIQLNNQTVAILHVWLGPETDPKLYRDFVTFLQTVCNQAEIYLRARRLETLAAETQKLSLLVTLLGEIQGQLDSNRLSLILANYGREVIGCDRVCVVIRRREKPKVLAVSGVETVDKKSSLVKSILVLSRRALAVEEPQWFTKGDKHAEDEEINQYFTGGNMRAAYVVPFKSREEKLVGAIVVETTRADGIGEPMRKLSQAVARHAGVALGSAESEASVPFLPTLRKLKQGKDWALGPKRRRVQLAIAVPLVLLVLIAIFPWPFFHVAGNCHLVPAKRANALSEVQGRIVKVLVQEGQVVKAGDVLAQMDDTELQRQLAITQQDAAKFQADADRYRNSREEGAQAARRVAEYAALKSAAEVGRLTHEIEMTKIRSPIDGVILAKELETRIGEMMDRGALFSEVGETSQWQALVEIKENDVALADRQLRDPARKGAPLEATVRTRGLTEKKIHGQVRRLEDISSQSYQPQGGGSNVFYATVELNLTPEEAAMMRSGFSGRGAIHLGWRPIGYILGRKFVDYLRVNWLL